MGGGRADGPVIQTYERAFAKTVGVRHAYSFSAARVGLYAILRALGVGPRDDVLLQVPTHVVVANAIRYVGARPVYVDCRPNDYNIDLTAAERLVGSRAKVLILQHTFGIPADIDAALGFCGRHRLHLLEDCVHALGATYRGKPVGSFGTAAFFSTEETKTISTTMGGVVVTDDDDLASAIHGLQKQYPFPSASSVMRLLIRLAVYHVLTTPSIHRYPRALFEVFGRRNPLPGPTTPDERRGERPSRYEERLADSQAALGFRQLKRLPENIRHRRAIAAVYASRLTRFGFAVPTPADGADPAFVRYPVWVDDRQAALRAIARHAVGGTWFTSVLEESESPSLIGYEAGTCPLAEAAASHLINLPTHPRVRLSDVEAITNALRRLAEDSRDRTAGAMRLALPEDGSRGGDD
jgi:dTDP-4-amino-4,6-dideoxygalactose transaminase